MGTLQMVEIDGGAQISVEIESLGRAILDGSAQATEANLELLREAIDDLSTYLDSLDPTHPDLPIRLVALFNKLRLARGEEAITEYEFFTPDLSVYPPFDRESAALNRDELFALASNCRREYQLSLLQWLRTPDDKEALEELVHILDELRAAARFGAVAQLWWVGSGLVEALQEDGSQASAEQKMLLGRLDQQIRRLVESGESELVRAPAEDLVRNLLYQIGQSQSCSARVVELKTAFDLNLWLGREQAQTERDAEQALDQRTILISEAITESKSLLLAYADPEKRDAPTRIRLHQFLIELGELIGDDGSALGDLARQLVVTAETLGRDTVAELAVILLNMLAALLLLERGMTRSDLSEHAWANQVEACLASLRELDHVDPYGGNADFFQTAIADLELSELVPAMSGETLSRLAGVEQALVEFAEDVSVTERLRSIPSDLRAVRSVLALLGRHSVVDLASLSERTVEDLVAGELIADPEVLESLAVAVGSIQNYAQGLAQRRAGLDEMVERGSIDLDDAVSAKQKPIDDPIRLFESMEYSFKAWLDDRTDEPLFYTLNARLRKLITLATARGADRIQHIGVKLKDLLGLIAHDSSDLSDEVKETLEGSMDSLRGFVRELELSEISASPGASGVPSEIEEVLHQTGRQLQRAQSELGEWTPRPGPPSEVQTALDLEVARIFANEALDHLNDINEAVASADEAEVTSELLRATHTLCGSSRSVGLHSMADACERMDKLLRGLKERQQRLAGEDVRLLRKLQELIASARLRIESNESLPDELHDQLHALAQQIEIRESNLIEQTRISDAPGKVTSAAGVDSELREFFCEEATDILVRMQSALSECRETRADVGHIATLRRELHTLKGSARAVGVGAIGDLAHNTESLLDRVSATSSQMDEGGLLELMEEVHDTLVEMIDRMRDGQAPPETGMLNQRVASFAGAPQQVQTPTAVVDQPAQVATKTEEPELPAVHTDAVTGKSWRQITTDIDKLKPSVVKHATNQGDIRTHVRVDTELLDSLVNIAGEVSVSRARTQEQIASMKDYLKELRSLFEGFRDQLRDLDIHTDSQIRVHPEPSGESQMSQHFDPLEFDRYTRVQQISRNLFECLDQIMTIYSSLTRYTGEAEEVLRQQAHLNSELQDGLLRTRMVAFSTQVPRLRHIVRQTGRELGKQVELEVVGGEVEIDRNVLQRMMGPFEHMIRNSLYHGIEDAAERRRRDKAEIGRITITCRQEGAECTIEYSDDGRGVDTDKIRQKAAQLGLLGDGTSLSDKELIQLLVVAGFSTADELTQLSGRGVGMDVVNNVVKQLGGNITAHNQPGKGIRFAMRLPLTLSITHALLVSAGGQSFAIPVSVVANVVKISSEQSIKLNDTGAESFEYGGQVYPYMNLAQRLGLKSEGITGKAPLLLVRMGARDVALEVDELIGTREVVVKPLGSQLAGIDGIAGGTVLGDGKVVIILDIAGLWLLRERAHQGTNALAATQESDDTLAACIVMVVDDSLTVRKVTSRSLEKYGIKVLCAKDGVDALDQLQQVKPDIMLVDIEMPGMDGFELTRRLRASPETEHISIVIITSRSGAKHKDKAMELGADVYLTKPYHEDVLLAHVKALWRARSQQVVNVNTSG